MLATDDFLLENECRHDQLGYEGQLDCGKCSLHNVGL